MNKDGSHDELMHFFYGILVYLACIPGLFALTLCGYTFLFERQSLLNVNVLIYFLPVLSMALTLWIVSKRESMERIPGFQKLSGLMTIIISTFIIILLFQKTRIWVLFVGSIWWIIGIFAILFIIIKIAWEKVAGGKAVLECGGAWAWWIPSCYLLIRI